MLGSLVLFGCAAAGCVAVGILFVLFGPLPVKRNPSRIRPMPAAAGPILIDPTPFDAAASSFGAGEPASAFGAEPLPMPSLVEAAPAPAVFAVEAPPPSAFSAPAPPPIVRTDSTPSRAARPHRKDPTPQRAAARSARPARASQPPPLPPAARRPAGNVPIAPVVMRTPRPSPAPLPRARAARGTELRHQQFREDERTDRASMFGLDEMTQVDERR